MAKPSMCEECQALLRHPHIASDTARFKELGVSEQTRPDGPPVVRKRYECLLCHKVWTMTRNPAEPAVNWSAET